VSTDAREVALMIYVQKSLYHSSCTEATGDRIGAGTFSAFLGLQARSSGHGGAGIERDSSMQAADINRGVNRPTSELSKSVRTGSLSPRSSRNENEYDRAAGCKAARLRGFGDCGSTPER
jgi:hypothetical protein